MPSARTAARAAALALSLPVLALAAACAGPVATGPASASPAGDVPEIRTDDVDRFYAVYDAAGGHPDAGALQAGYIDKASPGLKAFMQVRPLTAERLARAIAAKPAMFSGARKCADALPAVRPRLVAALARFHRLYPPMKSGTPVTVLIGFGNTGGTTDADNVLIGLETMCGADHLEADVEDRFVHLIAHEYAHVQQPYGNGPEDRPSVLVAGLLEGGADFLAELTSGSVSNTQLLAWTRGHEREYLARFLADADRPAEETDWFYRGVGTEQKPGDLGYWAGYRIARAYYEKARDKRAALAAILTVTPATAHAILEQSGIAADLASGRLEDTPTPSAPGS